MLLDGTHAHSDSLSDLRVTHPIQPMHEKNLPRPRADGIQHVSHPGKTLIAGQNLIRSGSSIHDERELLGVSLGVKMLMGVTARVDRQAQGGADQETFRLPHFSPTAAVFVHAQERFLNQIFRVLATTAPAPQDLLQVLK